MSFFNRLNKSSQYTRKVFCYGPYVLPGHSYNVAGVSKFRYVVDSVVKGGFDVEVVSYYQPNRLEKFRLVKISDRLKIRYLFPQLEIEAFGVRSWINLLMRQIAIRLERLRTFLFFLLKVRRNDVVVAYHAVDALRLLLRARRFNKFRLLLEVEEVYSDVFDLPEKRLSTLRKQEFQIFNAPDAFIFTTSRLNEIINSNKRLPFTVVHGAYKSNHINTEKFSKKDGKTHLVYAGTLFKPKGSALAVETAKFLTEKYHIHILGFGTSEEVREIQRTIAEVSPVSQCSVSFDGLLTGDEFTRFLQSCDVGLSTQNSNIPLNGTSFPSKILTYLVNGLYVVSVRMPTLEESNLTDLLHYYDGDNPCDVAKVIQNIDFSVKKDVRSFVDKLDERFCEEIKEIIQSL